MGISTSAEPSLAQDSRPQPTVAEDADSNAVNHDIEPVTQQGDSVPTTVDQAMDVAENHGTQFTAINKGKGKETGPVPLNESLNFNEDDLSEPAFTESSDDEDRIRPPWCMEDLDDHNIFGLQPGQTVNGDVEHFRYAKGNATCASINQTLANFIRSFYYDNIQLEFRQWLWCSRFNVSDPEITAHTAKSRNNLGENNEYRVPVLDAHFVVWTILPAGEETEERRYGKMVSFIGGTDIPVGLQHAMTMTMKPDIDNYDYPSPRTFTAPFENYVNEEGGAGMVWKDILMNPDAVTRPLKLTHSWIRDEWVNLDRDLGATVEMCIDDPVFHHDDYMGVTSMPTHLEQVRNAVQTAMDRVAAGADIKSTIQPPTILYVDASLADMKENEIDERHIRQSQKMSGITLHHWDYRKEDLGWDKTVDAKDKKNKKMAVKKVCKPGDESRAVVPNVRLDRQGLQREYDKFHILDCAQ